MNLNLTIGPFIGLILTILTALGIHLPIGFTATAITATAMLVIAAYTSIARFYHGDPLDDAKVWWKSKVIWTQIGGAATAGLALFGVHLGIPPEQLAEYGLAAASVFGVVFGFLTKKPIG